MSFLTFLRKSKVSSLFKAKERPLLTLMIPFTSNDPIRKENFRWLLQYWRNELPDAEIIIGSSYSKPFCKNEALNKCARRAHGKVLVILDADAYLEGEILTEAANMIVEEERNGNKIWLVPYRNLYRLTHLATEAVRSYPPLSPKRFPIPPLLENVEDHGDKRRYGHRYGAMLMMFPREAYTVLGGFDERFKGWGGEDIALVRSLDTLYAKHKSLERSIYHLWHPIMGSTYITRMWPNQKRAQINSHLAVRYHIAGRDPLKMRALVDEGARLRASWFNKLLNKFKR